MSLPECARPRATSVTHGFQSARGLGHSKTLVRVSLRQSRPTVRGSRAINIWAIIVFMGVRGVKWINGDS